MMTHCFKYIYRVILILRPPQWGGDRGSREFREFRESAISRKFFPGTPGNDSKMPGTGSREFTFFVYGNPGISLSFVTIIPNLIVQVALIIAAVTNRWNMLYIDGSASRLHTDSMKTHFVEWSINRHITTTQLRFKWYLQFYCSIQ